MAWEFDLLAPTDGGRFDYPAPMTTAAERFSETAEGYAATMAPSLRPIAAEVVRRAGLARGERVIDLGTGTGIAAAEARGEGRSVVGIDAAAGMLEIARTEVAGVEFRVADFSDLPFPDGAFDVAIAAHALLFSDDQVATLREWRRVVRPGGRVSLSVPGPSDVTPRRIYADVWARFGIRAGASYPQPNDLVAHAATAGWIDATTATDPGAAIRLPDDEAFRLWRSIGSRSDRTDALTEDDQARLTEAMLAVTPRDSDGTLRIPFGAIYLTARSPSA